MATVSSWSSTSNTSGPSSATSDLTWNAEDATACCQDAGAQKIPDSDFILALVPVLKLARMQPASLIKVFADER